MLTSLRGLSRKICQRALSSKPATVVSSYLETKRYIEVLRETHLHQRPIKVEQHRTKLFCALQNVWKPVCITGEYIVALRVQPKELIKRSSPQGLVALVRNLNKPVTITETTIDHPWLDCAVLKKLALKFKVSSIGNILRPSALIIHAPGSDLTIANKLLKTIPDDNHVGRFIAVMDSEFTGGELEVSYNGHTETVSADYVACKNECTWNLTPVTSGTQILVVYDIYDHVPVLPVAHLCGSDSNRDCSDTDGSNRDSDSEDEHHSDGDIDSDADTDKDANTDTETDSGTDTDTASSDDSNANSRIIKDHFEYSGRYKTLFHNMSMDSNDCEDLRRAVSAELDKLPTIIIALDTLYPECQSSSDHLQGGDRALYEMLQSHYTVEVVAATIHNQYGDLSAALYSRALVKQALSGHCSHIYSDVSSKMVIPNKLRRDQVLDPIVYDNIYMVSGLRVSRKE